MSEGLAVGDEVDLEVGPIAHGGHCVARHEGQVLFVRHTAPGEQVRARVTEIGPGGRYVRADAIEIGRPVAGRVPAPCPYAGPGACGGCDFPHPTLSAQRDLKTAVVREQFSRLAKLDLDATVESLGGAAAEADGLRWRSRSEFAIDDAGRAGMRRHRSHEVLPIKDCLIAAEGIVETGVLQQDWPDAEVVDVVAPSVGEPVVRPQPSSDPTRFVTEYVRVDWVDGTGAERTFAHTYEVAAEGFWQIHRDAGATFVQRVLTLLDPRPGERALDLYAGVGLFAAALADAVGSQGQVIAIESDRLACLAAQTNLADWPSALVVPGRVDDLLGVARPARRGPGNRQTRTRKPRRSPLVPHTADLVVLDPPRTGAGMAVVRELAALRPRTIAYVACDPAALARDSAALAEVGYRVAEVTAYDAFPMTHHIECIAAFVPDISCPGTSTGLSGGHRRIPPLPVRGGGDSPGAFVAAAPRNGQGSTATDN